MFFCNSGLEANEARDQGRAQVRPRQAASSEPEIVVYEKAFHGRSLATLSATGNRKVQAGFEPLVEGFVRVPLNDIDGGAPGRRAQPNVVAVFLEPIQGEGGINVRALEYLRGLQRDLRRSKRLAASCSTRCSAAWAAPASGSRTSGPASCPT